MKIETLLMLCVGVVLAIGAVALVTWISAAMHAAGGAL